ncbi:MAG: hypothetical protein WC471_03960 [Candidatus Woesearchaeota archaeon]|jgi:hypothetical protein
MAKKMKKEEKCCDMEYGHCHKCKGISMLLLGVLIFLYDYYNAPLGWAFFIGTVLVAKGLLSALMHKCKC